MNYFEKGELVRVDIPTSPLHGKELIIQKVNKETCDFIVDGEPLRLYKTGLKSLKYPKVNKELQAVEKQLKAIQKEMLDDILELNDFNGPVATGYVNATVKWEKRIKALLNGNKSV